MLFQNLEHEQICFVKGQLKYFILTNENFIKIVPKFTPPFRFGTKSREKSKLSNNHTV